MNTGTTGPCDHHQQARHLKCLALGHNYWDEQDRGPNHQPTTHSINSTLQSHSRPHWKVENDLNCWLSKRTQNYQKQKGPKWRGNRCYLIISVYYQKKLMYLREKKTKVSFNCTDWTYVTDRVSYLAVWKYNNQHVSKTHKAYEFLAERLRSHYSKCEAERLLWATMERWWWVL